MDKKNPKIKSTCLRAMVPGYAHIATSTAQLNESAVSIKQLLVLKFLFNFNLKGGPIKQVNIHKEGLLNIYNRGNKLVNNDALIIIIRNLEEEHYYFYKI